MKKILTPFLFIISIYTNAQKDTLGIQLSDSTAIGAADGKLLSKEIGTAGGEIISDDGRVKLIFPTGALTANTTISIQPTANFAPNGVGKSYWFEPSGIQFKKPVQIIFHYTGKESEICPPEWMSLAVQDHKGKWTFIDYDEWDSTANQLKGFIYHFSGVSNINNVQLKSEDYFIPVNGSTFIDIVDVTRPQDNGNEIALLNQNNPVLWYANKELHGNDKTGRIKQESLPFLKKTKFVSAKYTAPAYMPEINAVAIWAEIYGRTKTGKVLRRRLTTYVDVYDAYKITLVHEFTGRVGFGSKLEDEASFVAYIYSSKILIDQIQNYPAKAVVEGSRITIKEKVYVDGAPGTIHIKEDTKNYELSNNFPPKVYFEFESSELLYYTLQYVIPRMGIETEKVLHKWKAIPENISFMANGRTQRYNYPGNKDLVVMVTPYRQE